MKIAFRVLQAVFCAGYAGPAGAMRATIHRAFRFHAVADDFAAAVGTCGGQRMNGALETVEVMRFTGHDHFKSLVIRIAAHFTSCHFTFSFGIEIQIAASQAQRRLLLAVAPILGIGLEIAQVFQQQRIEIGKELVKETASRANEKHILQRHGDLRFVLRKRRKGYLAAGFEISPFIVDAVPCDAPIFSNVVVSASHSSVLPNGPSTTQ